MATNITPSPSSFLADEPHEQQQQQPAQQQEGVFAQGVAHVNLSRGNSHEVPDEQIVGCFCCKLSLQADLTTPAKRHWCAVFQTDKGNIWTVQLDRSVGLPPDVVMDRHTALSDIDKTVKQRSGFWAQPMATPYGVPEGLNLRQVRDFYLDWKEKQYSLIDANEDDIFTRALLRRFVPDYPADIPPATTQVLQSVFQEGPQPGFATAAGHREETMEQQGEGQKEKREQGQTHSAVSAPPVEPSTFFPQGFGSPFSFPRGTAHAASPVPGVNMGLGGIGQPAAFPTPSQSSSLFAGAPVGAIPSVSTLPQQVPLTETRTVETRTTYFTGAPAGDIGSAPVVSATTTTTTTTTALPASATTLLGRVLPATSAPMGTQPMAGQGTQPIGMSPMGMPGVPPMGVQGAGLQHVPEA